MPLDTITRQRFNRRGLHKKVKALETADAGFAPLVIPTYTVANKPTAVGNTGKLIRVSNGATGSPCLAVSDGTTWNRVLIGAAVAAS